MARHYADCSFLKAAKIQGVFVCSLRERSNSAQNSQISGLAEEKELETTTRSNIFCNHLAVHSNHQNAVVAKSATGRSGSRRAFIYFGV